MPPGDTAALWERLNATGQLSGRALHDPRGSVDLDSLVRGSSLGAALERLRGRSVLLAVKDQLSAALALIELDGVVRRVVLCTPDLSREHLAGVAQTAEADAAVVSELPAPEEWIPNVPLVVASGRHPVSSSLERNGCLETEWVLLTSGTTGAPKLVQHTLATLTGPIKPRVAEAGPPVWSTFYDIRRYGGLQILLRALLGGGSLVLSSADEPIGDFLGRASAHGATHILGTPTHWWLALTSTALGQLTPHYVRLSGETADQAILDRLRATFPGVPVVHAFASTEAGVAFEIGDGRAGFPVSLLGRNGVDVQLKVEEGTLRIRSARIAKRYLGASDGALAGPDGFVDTHDMIEPRGERCYFAGRKDGVINVGGQKIHPEEVEAVINAHPQVRMSLVQARKNPITGAIVVAELVLHAETTPSSQRAEALRQEILRLCRAKLARHKVPAVVRFVATLPMTSTGKIARHRV